MQSGFVYRLARSAAGGDGYGHGDQNVVCFTFFLAPHIFSACCRDRIYKQKDPLEYVALRERFFGARLKFLFLCVAGVYFTTTFQCKERFCRVSCKSRRAHVSQSLPSFSRAVGWEV